MKIIYYFLICFLIITSCKSINNTSVYNEENLNKYFETTILPAKGIIVLAHGLNTNPSKMGNDKNEGTLTKLFLDAGFHVYRVTLPGHSGSIKEMQNINSQDWLNSALKQYHEASEIAYENDIPIYLAAFSLGALVYLNLMFNEKDVNFEKAVFFAPAVAVKRITRTGISAANIFLTNSAIISSRAPIEYRAQRGVSISAYKALFELENTLNKNEFANCNIPALIFIDPNDELISISKLQKRISKFNLTNWKIETISNTGAEINPKYHHLIIDNKSVSSTTWDIIREKIIYFLEE